MKLGQKAMEQLRAEVTGCLKPGDELLVIGPVALSGTVLLTEASYGFLREFFSEGFLREASYLEQKYGTGSPVEESSAWKAAEAAGATALIPMGESGVLSALWKMAEASGVGLTADLRRIPIRQETIEICEKLDINPYKLWSRGGFLAGIPSGEGLVQTCCQMGIMAAVIGQTNKGNDRLLYSGENVRYLERPGRDEKEKLWQD